MIQYRQRDPSAGNKGKYNNIVSRVPISMNTLNTSSTIHQKQVIMLLGSMHNISSTVIL